MDLYPWSPPNHFTSIFLHEIMKIPRCINTTCSFNIFDYNYKLHNLMGKTKSTIMSLTLPLSQKSNCCHKETIMGSNHFKVHILESLLWKFDQFALDGAKLYYAKVQGNQQEKKGKKRPWEIHLWKMFATTFWLLGHLWINDSAPVPGKCLDMVSQNPIYSKSSQLHIDIIFRFCFIHLRYILL